MKNPNIHGFSILQFLNKQMKHENKWDPDKNYTNSTKKDTDFTPKTMLASLPISKIQTKYKILSNPNY